MPTRTIDTQTFEGEQIQCAKFVSDEPFSWKAAQIVSAECDYEFQMVAKSSVATTLTIQVGDTVKTQAITTDFTRFVIPFPSVTNDVDSLYISFPSGTYWLYNLQLERASTPSAWRPAPEDAEDHADQAAANAADMMTQQQIFNKLTNNGQAQGMYLLDGNLYLNGSYIQAGQISANRIYGGTLSGAQINIGNGAFTVDQNGKVIADNMNIEGGSFNIRTSTLSQNVFSAIYDTYSVYISPYSYHATRIIDDQKCETILFADSINFYQSTNGTGDGYSSLDYDSLNIYCKGNYSSPCARIYAGTGSASSSAGLQLFHGNGDYADIRGNSLIVWDTNGVARIELNYITGLQFRNSSGTVTKTYGPT